MDANDPINLLENTLRDLIERMLGSVDGDDDAADRLGVSEERIEEWRGRRDEESKRRVGGDVETRLLYFSDFTDLEKIIGRNWDKGFKACFGDKKRFTVYMDRLGAFRNPDAHSRALLPHEEHLLLGMSGELRQAVTIFLSSGAGGDEPEYFARIEEVRDNFGMRATGTSSTNGMANSETILRPGDVLSFVCSAWDPEDGTVEWRIERLARDKDAVTIKGTDITWDWNVSEEDISDHAFVSFKIKSDRPYSRSAGVDDTVLMFYRVLPVRIR